MVSKADKGGDGTARRAGVAGHAQHVPAPEVDDETLRRCIAGDRKAETVFVQIYQKRIAGYAFALLRSARIRDDPNDVAQDVFRRAFARHGSGGLRFFVPLSEGGTAKVSTWLCRIAYNLVIDRIRRKEREVETVTLDTVEQIPSSSSPQRDRERAEQLAVLAEGMASLPDEYRKALILREVEGKSYKEIARICNIPENTAKSRVARGRAGLRKFVKGNGDEQEGESNDG